MNNTVIELALKQTKTIFLLMAIMTFGFAAFSPTLKIDTDQDILLAKNPVERVFHNQVNKEFFLYESIAVGLANEEGAFKTETLTDIHRLTQSVLKVIEQLFTPLLYTSIISPISFRFFTLTLFTPVPMFDLFVGIGILLSFLLTVFFIPAYITRKSDIPFSELQSRLHPTNSSRWIVKPLPGFGRFSWQWPKTIIVVFVLAFSTYGAQKIKDHDNPVGWFKESNHIRVANNLLNNHIAGTCDGFFVVIFTGRKKLEQELICEIQSEYSYHPVLRNYFFSQFLSTLSFGKTVGHTLGVSFDVNEKSDLNTLSEMLSISESFTSQSKYSTPSSVLHYIERLKNTLHQTGYVGKNGAITYLVKTVNREFMGRRKGDVTFRGFRYLKILPILSVLFAETGSLASKTFGGVSLE